MAELLERRGVPFLLVSGYDATEVPARFRNVLLLSKPLTLNTLGRGLRQIGTIRA